MSSQWVPEVQTHCGRILKLYCGSLEPAGIGWQSVGFLESPALPCVQLGMPASTVLNLKKARRLDFPHRCLDLVLADAYAVRHINRNGCQCEPAHKG